MPLKEEARESAMNEGVSEQKNIGERRKKSIQVTNNSSKN